MQVKRFKCTPVFEKNYGNPAPVVVNVGSVRSSKSYSVAQCLIAYACQFTGLKIGICRKVAATLPPSVIRPFFRIMDDFGVYRRDNYQKQERFYVFDYGDGNPVKSEILFFGLDDADKIKSTEFNVVWLEEATDFTIDDFTMLQTRLSAREPAGWWGNQLFLSLNPSDARGWIKTWLLPQKDVCLINSTYKDNPFLSQAYINTLLAMKDTNPQKYRMLVLGEWGVSEGRVFDRWQLYDDASAPKAYDGEVYGLDFGFNHATALIKCSFKEDAVYLREVIYQTHITNSDLIALMGQCGIDRGIDISADSAEPDRIREIANAGYNCLPVKKTTVLSSIDTVKKYKIFIHKDSKNLQEEFNNYEWKKNLSGQYLDNIEPNKQQDDAVAAVRYGVQHYDAIANAMVAVY